MSQPQSCGRKSVLATLLLLFFTLLFPLTTTATPLTPEAANTTLDISSLYLDADADCVGYEGQWNCLSDTFQHCTSGKWTAALSCSSESGALDSSSNSVQNSLCTPLGRTDQVEFGGECSAAWGFGGGGSGWGGGGNGGRGTVCNGNGCYYGAGANLTVEKWVYVLVVGVVALGFM
ncbi:hypothetical protein CkaCkLH20_12769 [Colletotrichum karsti]|uniref:Uncharacterized protein n=1 Tax=Colletotrichum karsti TaxID=1095194 RepID=A0A9P6HVP7_9PEZI|nr:uncharacterized protein CkaCkLH20_12769 [Colletotrichum karsti]KAF9869726.1 hypothetical protein CkaCkLH20_12769 [Colletotrichum karsti]